MQSTRARVNTPARACTRGRAHARRMYSCADVWADCAIWTEALGMGYFTRSLSETVSPSPQSSIDARSCGRYLVRAALWPRTQLTT